MTYDGILVLDCLFDTVFSLFTSWTIPGTNITPLGAFLFLAFAGLVLRWLSRLFYVDLGLSVLTPDYPDPAPDLLANAPALGTRAWVSGNMRSHK